MRTFIYARISTELQGVENQIEAISKFVEANGWEATQVFSDIGMYTQRDEMIDQIKQSTEEGRIVIWSFNRISRDPGHLIELAKILRKHNFTIISATEGSYENIEFSLHWNQIFKDYDPDLSDRLRENMLQAARKKDESE